MSPDPIFEQEDWKLFKTLETITQPAGVDRDQLPKLIAKELADNALDAMRDTPGFCQVGMLEDLNGFYVDDDGDGIEGDDDFIAHLFSIARPMTSTKRLRLPTRGALGNGLRVVAGVVLSTAGSLGIITRGRALRLHVGDDGTTRAERLYEDKRIGTRVEVVLGPGLEVTPLSLSWAKEAIRMTKGGSRYVGLTSPWWYDSDSFHALFDAATTQTVAGLVKKFDGFSGSKGEKVAKEYGRGRLANSLSFADTETLLETLRDSGKIRPFNAERLGGIGRINEFPKHHAKRADTFVRQAARGEQSAVIPYVVEVWAEPMQEGPPDVKVSVNRTPVTSPMTAFHAAKDKKIHLSGCGLKKYFKVGKEPLRIRLNVDTPYMPIISAGKAPDLSPFRPAIEALLQRVANAAKVRAAPGGEAKSTQEAVIEQHLDEAIALVSGGGASRYSLRQLFYKIRPHLIAAIGAEPKFKTFSQAITKIENRRDGDLPGIYRDTRGILYHPHSGQEIPLGTLSVEGYNRPAWTFNKVLYCEKEGFFPLLKDAAWPERNDCALLTSKGFATRAARDVIDLLGKSKEPLTFYCIHDADASGTRIYQALTRATAARKARKVEVVNLGLDPWEALEMGLEVEPVEKSTKRRSVADYIKQADGDWDEWLQTNRVELNAMTTPQFLEWLNRKFEPYSDKVVPPVPVRVDQIRRVGRASLDASIRAKILRDAAHEGQVARAYDAIRPELDRMAESSGDHLTTELATNPAQLWTAPVSRMAEDVVRDRAKIAV